MKKVILLLSLWILCTHSFAAEISVEGCASATVIQASANVADFESLEGTDLVDRSAPYVENGFVLTTNWENIGNNPGEDKFVSMHEGSSFYAGSVSFNKKFSDDFPILTRQGGESFDLISIDLDTLWLGNANVEFTGTKADGGTVVQSFVTDANRNQMETFTFTGFDDLVSVSWKNLESATLHHVDNIVVDMADAISWVAANAANVVANSSTDQAFDSAITIW